MTTTEIPTEPKITSTLLAAALLTVLGDYLLWPARPGLSLGIFAVVAGAATVVKRPETLREPRTVAALGLQLASAFQAAIEISFSNVLVLSLLLAALSGETLFRDVRPFWLRAVEGTLALLRAPARWHWVAGIVARAPLQSVPFGRWLLGFWQIGLPTLVVTAAFSMLLGSGNAILAHGFSAFFTGVWNAIVALDLSFGHALFWMLLATLSLGLTCRTTPLLAGWLEGRAPRPVSEPGDPRVAIWRSCAILAALNVLFGTANTIDAVYLWVHQVAPAGVNYSEYVHQGVYSLIAAVLLSAALLVAILQQAANVTGSRVLRALSYAWIAQNLVLTAGVLQRLKLYVETYELTELRLYVGFFLILVSAGFLLLMWRIACGHSLAWLLSANLLASFGLFAIVQFLDTSRWIADYNVNVWLQSHRRGLDIDYLGSLGAPAYPALIRVSERLGRTEASEAAAFLEARRAEETARLAHLDWRSRQWRLDLRARELTEHRSTLMSVR